MKSYHYLDNVFTFEGAISVQVEPDWVRPWRIEHRYFDFYPVLTDEKAKNCSGVRICFTSDTINLQLNLVEPAEGMRFDLFINNNLHQQLVVNRETPQVIFKPLPTGLKKIEIWPDQQYSLQLHDLLVDDQAFISKTVFDQKRWVHYGSSISQSNAGKSPSQIWAALVARKWNLHLTNLGFSGQCKLEPMVARIIRDRPADYITLKLGINLYSGDLTQRTFAPNVIGLIQIIREKHPETPLAVISPIYSSPREEALGGGGLNLPMMREIIAGIVESCKKYGDHQIHYIDGLKIFGPAEASEYMPDNLHPNGDGQFILAENFSNNVFKRLPFSY